VLLILSEDALGQARVLAGTMTATLRISVSLQIILRALIEDGLKRRNHPDLAATIEAHAIAIRHARRVARRRPRPDPPGRRRGASLTRRGK
jgi:hypothetical protein